MVSISIFELRKLLNLNATLCNLTQTACSAQSFFNQMAGCQNVAKTFAPMNMMEAQCLDHMHQIIVDKRKQEVHTSIMSQWMGHRVISCVWNLFLGGFPVYWNWKGTFYEVRQRSAKWKSPNVFTKQSSSDEIQPTINLNQNSRQK